ncbi:MAG: TlpA family protein disulfide reductase [Phycisphaeraceae bacterium]|nr:TlpA family protein disulfide reductase [Phycisphaeraceae bacterium]
MKTARLVLAAAALTMTAVSLAAPPADGVMRVGSGETRATLNAMELTPFDASLWGTLTGWTDGAAVDAAAADGKPVLIFTWRSWHKVSQTSLPVAQRMLNRFGKDGLVVVGVHDARGYDMAAQVAKDAGYTGPIAHDSTGAFGSGLNAKHAPAYYILDRAGNVRFADVDASSLEKALSIVAGESKEQAAAVPGTVAANAAKRADEAMRSRTISGEYRPGALLDVPFQLPDISAYEGAKWPDKNTQSLTATNVQGQALPASFGSETWLTDPPKSNGRVVVIDFWATWCGPCKKAMPKIDEMYKANKADLVVIGLSDEPAGTVKNFLNSHRHAYSQATDTSKTISKALQVQGIPHVVVMSTDGIVRWQGNPLDPAFAKAVGAVIAADPGVAARRQAEVEYLKTNKS